ncbi:MAG: ABC-F family ATP-binding cassette domain-containing protein [Peptostreptococcus sp.]|jgi:ABC transporter, ATP-binding protein|uniref:ABC-F family ATP-binding cassette domain-containing protein n=1 Tax=Peptostreptococcus sp. TaxID=1262 RepID=UPI001CB66438|nr:ABC-F family ATP-binding cassette domain-containing protein [Peptostreptococcus sp.]MBF1044855.1 ABC-F family ATP-binding cassette domain-containing protein [Peptostreptococcus sp.]
MIMLSCNNVSKSFGVETILEDISFSVNEGDKIGIVGVNGTGKTTLFKVITGIFPHDKGDIFTSKNCRLGYLEQNTNFYSEKTIYDEVVSVFSDLIEAEEELRSLEHQIASLSAKESSSGDQLKKAMDTYGKKYEEFEKKNGYAYKSEVRGTLKGLGFSDEEMNKPVNVLSGGEKTRVLLAKLLLSKPSLLLLDEPTNHLDADAIEWLEAFLRSYEETIMIISHDRYFLDQSVNRIFEMENKRLTSYNGNYTEYQKQAKINREIRLRQYENQQRDIKKQEESIERLKAYGREKHLKRARSKEKMLDKVDRLDKPQELRKKARFNFVLRHHSGNDVLKAQGLGKSFGDRKLFEGVDFDLYRGEKVALIGPNGVGKSTLFKIIMGDESQDQGEYKLGQGVDIAYFHQEQKSLNLENSIIDEVWDDNPHMTQTEVRNLLGAFLFEGEDVFKSIRSLSGGERARVAILKLILSKSNLLLLDEPTNHLDIDSKEVLEDALKEYEGTLLTISHDRYFLNTVVDRILVLKPDGIEEYLGNYEYYQNKKKEESEKSYLAEMEDLPSKTKTQIKEERRREKELKKNENKAKKLIKDIEVEIELLEKQIGGLDYMLCQEEVYTSPERTREVNQEKSDLEKRLSKLYEKWEQIVE